jgi:hypothetical protein
MILVYGERFRGAGLPGGTLSAQAAATATAAIQSRSGSSTCNPVATVIAVKPVAARAAVVTPATISGFIPATPISCAGAEARIPSLFTASAFTAEDDALA